MALSLIAYPKIIFSQAIAPESIQGRIWLDTDDGKIYYYDGSSWVSMTPTAGSIQEIYTGTGFNSAATTTTENVGEYELLEIPATSLTYAKITIKGNYVHTSSDVPARHLETQNKIQIKEIGGAYGDIGGYVSVMDTNFSAIFEIDKIVDYTIIHQLTAGQKTNGFQLKLFSRCYCYSGGGSSCSFNNVSSMVELL